MKSSNLKAVILLLCLSPITAFSETITFECKYTNWSDNEGLHKVKDKFELNFIIDKETSKSYMLGNNGSTEVIPIKGESQFSFIEITASKNVMTTSIDNKLNSVHSRNSVMFGDIIPSQYYGKCEVK